MVRTLLVFATFAIGFVARPVGGLIFGQIGDRVGHKRTLIMTMLIMGVATFLIGVIPTYDSIGTWRRSCWWSCRSSRGRYRR